MRYEGKSFKSNFMNAVGSNDIELQRDIILDQIAELIKTNVGSVVDALIKSGVSVPDKYTKIDIIDLVSKSIYGNAEFQKNIGFLIQKKTLNFSNGVGDAPAPAPTTGSGIGAALSGFLSGGLGTIFSVVGSVQDRKSAEANAKASLYGKIFGEDDKQKTNYIPIVIIGSVLLLGGIIAVVILKQK